MKKRVLILIITVILAFSVFALTSCDGLVIPGLNTGTGTGNGTSSTYLVTYSYNGANILTQTVNANAVISASQIAEKDALDVNHFYSDAACETEFDFSKKITADTTIYCKKFYTLTYHFGNEIILEHKVDALNAYLSASQRGESDTLKYVGYSITDMFTDKEKTAKFDNKAEIKSNLDIYCQIKPLLEYRYRNNNDLILKQYIDFETGFTEEQLKARDEMLYQGFLLDYFYADSLGTTEFDFTKTPTKKTIVYCDRNDKKAGPNVTWSVVNSGKTLKFEGSGPMYEYQKLDFIPWKNYSSITKIDIAEGITSVADWAFYQFSAIGDVKLPSTIQYIGNGAFYGSSITSVNFPDPLETIGETAFRDCLGLTKLMFNPGLKKIKASAFWNCRNVTTMILTDSIMNVETNTFKNLDKLKTAYYIGTEEQYNQINTLIENHWLTEYAHKYFLSEERPSEPGPFWYYGENGSIKQWYYAVWYIKNDTFKVPCDVDYIDATVGVTQANVNKQNNITTEGYKFVGWYTKIDERIDKTAHYNLTLGEVFTEDLELVGDRGKLCGDNLQWSRRGGTLTISKIDDSISDGSMWDFEFHNSAPWYSNPSWIQRVIIEDGVTHIGSHAFYEVVNKTEYYSSLSYIDIPTSVTSISGSAFDTSSHLLYIYYAGNPEQLEAVSGVEAVLADTSVPYVKFYTKVEKEDFATLGEGNYWCYLSESSEVSKRVAWSYKDGELLVGGGNTYSSLTRVDTVAHKMFDYASAEDTPWYTYKDDVTSIVINKNITHIGAYSFDGMQNVSSISIDHLTDRISFISSTAFTGTKYYTEMYDKNGVVYVYNSDSNPTFRNAFLIKVNPDKASELFILDKTALVIAEGAFDGCSSIKKLVLKSIPTANMSAGSIAGLTSLEHIYYDGLLTDWIESTDPEAEQKDTFKDHVTDAEAAILDNTTIYILSNNKPNDPNYSYYWHWNTDETLPEIWQ